MDIYAVGKEIGRLTLRMDRVEKRMEAWKHLWQRIGLLLILWTAVLIAGTSVDQASTFTAGVIKKLMQ